VSATSNRNSQQSGQNERSKAHGFISLGVLCIATGPIFVKLISGPGSLIAFYRLLFAALLLTPIAYIHQHRQPRPLSRKIVLTAILGGVAFSINVALWVTALSMTTASKVTLLDNTAPIWVGLISWLLLGKRENRLYWIGLLVTFIGAGMMINLTHFQFDSRQGLGDLLAILSGFTYALYLLITSHIRSQMDSITYSSILACSGTLALFLFNWATGYLNQPMPTRSLALIFLMAVSSQVLGWLLINQALGMLPVNQAAIILLGQPLVATLLGMVILKEIPTPIQAVGGILCLVGIFLVQQSNGG